MTWVAAAVVAGSTLVSGYMGAKAAKQAGQQYADAATAGIAAQQEMFDTLNKQAAPYRGLGYSSLNTLGSLLPGKQQVFDPATGEVTGTQMGTGYLTKPFDMADVNNYMSPNYRFALEQGTGAMRSGLNAAGGLVGGNAMKGIEDYTQNLATGSINDAMKNYYIGQQAVSGNLSNIANIGLGGQGLTSTAGMNTSNNISSLLSSMGNAQASATMGAANAYTSGLNNLGGYAMLYGMKNFMNPTPKTTVTG